MAIKIQLKEFVYDEPIQIEDKDGQTYDFKMQITAKENKEIENIIKNTEEEGMFDRQECFENIIFKDQKEKIKELAVGSYYDDLVGQVMGFLLEEYTKKKLEEYKKKQKL